MTLATEGIWFVYMDKNSPVNCVTKISQHSMESIYIKEKSMALCIKFGLHNINQMKILIVKFTRLISLEAANVC